MRRPDGTRAVGAQRRRRARGTTRCSPDRRASPTRCAAPRSLADVVGEPRPAWAAAADVLAERRRRRGRDAFEPKDRWAMDWYYPVLTGALHRRAGQGPPGRRLGRVRHGGQGHPLRQRRAVGHRLARPPSARSPTPRSATSPPPPTCSRWTRSHRRDDGSYWTGIVYPSWSASPPARRRPTPAPPSSSPPTRSPAPSPASGVFVPR